MIELWQCPILFVLAVIALIGGEFVIDWAASRHGVVSKAFGTILGFAAFLLCAVAVVTAIIGLGGTLIWITSFFDPQLGCLNNDCPNFFALTNA